MARVRETLFCQMRIASVQVAAGGRPKTGALTRACRDVLERRVPGEKGRTYAEAIAERLAELALQGYMPAMRELADRAEGRAGQTLEIETRLQRLEPQSAYLESAGHSSEEGSSSEPVPPTLNVDVST